LIITGPAFGTVREHAAVHTEIVVNELIPSLR
jgi:hypothetical protein